MVKVSTGTLWMEPVIVPAYDSLLVCNLMDGWIFVVSMAGNKKHGGDQLGVCKMPNASERARNRASPFPVVRLYDHLSSDQRKSIEDMDLGTMLDIKCHVLHNPLISWLAPLYDSHSREFVIPGCGRIPLNADSIYRTLGLPRGDIPVVYAMDSGIEARLDGPFVVNIWSKKDVDTVLDADLKRDGSGYGNLECQDKVARLMGEFASGITSLMSKLVQGWTEVEDNELVDTAKIDKRVRAKIGVFRLSDAGGAANTMSPIAQSTDVRPAQILGKSPIRRLKNVPCNQSADATDVGGASTAAPFNVLDSMSSHVTGEQTNVVAEVPVVEQTRVTRFAARAASVANVPGQADKVPVVNFSDNMSDVESYHSANDSDYVDESVSVRFVIRSRCPVDVSEHANIMVSECGVVPSQTTLSGVATDVPGVSPELGSSGVAMHIDGVVAEPSEADAIVRVMETDSTIPPSDNRIEFQGLENLAETVAMHIDGVVDEPDSANGNQMFVSEKNDDDVLGSKYVPVDAAVSTIGVKSVIAKGSILKDRLQGSTKILGAGTSTVVATDSQISVDGGSDEGALKDVVVPFKSTSQNFATEKGSPHEEPLEASFAPLDFGTSVTNQTADTVGDVADNASIVIGTAIDVARDVEQNATTVPQGNSNGHHSIIPVDVVKESETANVSSIPPTDDVELLYITPALPVPVHHLSIASRTPRTKLRMARVVFPSKFMLPPYNRVTSTDEQVILYQQVIKHNSESENSKIKESTFLMIEPMWVSTSDLASSVMPSGELSSTVAEIGIVVLQVDCQKKKIIFPWIVTVYLLERKFDSKLLKKHFRMDEKYKLSHQNLLSFAVLQNLGTVKKPCGHWYSVFLNFEKKRFEVLDSARGPDDESLITRSSDLVDAIKSMYRINYSSSSKQIDEYELVFIDAPKQNNKYVFFVLSPQFSCCFRQKIHPTHLFSVLWYLPTLSEGSQEGLVRVNLKYLLSPEYIAHAYSVVQSPEFFKFAVDQNSKLYMKFKIPMHAEVMTKSHYFVDRFMIKFYAVKTIKKCSFMEDLGKTYPVYNRLKNEDHFEDHFHSA
ncbi:hypothetical protein ACQ4PT_003638 [Festuca glaucescens]